MFFLRDYQKEIIVRIHEAWKLHRSVMVQMPTGTGKTHVLAGTLLNPSCEEGLSSQRRVLIVAHRVELVAQIRETLLKLKIKSENIRVESIQTTSRRIDSLDFSPDLIVIDEAHHALAKTYRILWEKWPEAKFLGLTATPCRMSRNGFTDLFDTLVTSWSIAEFIRKGVLSAFDYVSILPNSREQLLIDSLEKRGADGDYQVKEMDAVLNKRTSIERLYQSVERYAEGKKGIVYAISIDHARKIAEHYNRQGVRTAAIDSRTPGEERRRMVEAFKRGEIQVLVNVDVFSEGFDCPDVEFVQMARPTLSLAKYLQQVGRGLRRSEGKESCMLIDNVGLCRVFGLPVQAWDWERMFRGALAGKGRREAVSRSERVYSSSLQAELPDGDRSMGMVISHDALLAKLDELDQSPATEEKTAELKAWQDAETGLWGLRQGRERKTKAVYVTVFDIRDGQAAVRFTNHDCGLVDETGKVLWKRKGCQCLQLTRNKFLEIRLEGGKELYVDLCNGKAYNSKPEIRRYGKFEVLKVGHKCYSRTRKLYSSRMDFYGLIISDKGFLLSIFESTGNSYAILEGDMEDFYRIHRWLADGSAIVSNSKGKVYRVTKAGKLVYLDDKDSHEEAIARLEERVRQEMEEDEESKKRKIQEEYRKAMPYQSGLKWGLKVGNRITVPPIYRNVRPPVGKFCAVEKNYSQWGIISIDGSILVETKYPDVSIEENGTAWLTQVTGRKVRVELK